MSDSLAALELQRSQILLQILHLGDFRSGSITTIHRRCGKPNCHCHQPGQPGHGEPSKSAEEFGRLYREAWNCGLSRAGKIVILGDGADGSGTCPWRQCHPGAALRSPQQPFRT